MVGCVKGAGEGVEEKGGHGGEWKGKKSSKTALIKTAASRMWVEGEGDWDGGTGREGEGDWDRGTGRGGVATRPPWLK